MEKIIKLAEKCALHEIQKIAIQLNEQCPVAQVNTGFSPEIIAREVSGSTPEQLFTKPLIWECLCCGMCENGSKGVVKMTTFIREMRALAAKQGYSGTETHGGLVAISHELNASSDTKPNRTGWIPSSLRVKYDRGDTVYWVGGAPFFVAQMPNLAQHCLKSAAASIRFLNLLGITPAILGDERFSGHDPLWTGNVDLFKKLATLNTTTIEKSGARRIVVSSPEDYYTLKKSYPEAGFTLKQEIVHISELIADNLNKFKFSTLEQTVTYHDPCYLGRGMGVYDAPRRILNAIPGLKLVEMEHSRDQARCCGTSCWSQCTRNSKRLQVMRLQEAAATGASVMLTTCGECLIHFNCTLSPDAWQQVPIAVEDLTVRAGMQLI